MSKKKINVDSMVNELEGASLYFKKQPTPLSKSVNVLQLDKSLHNENALEQPNMPSEDKKVTHKSAYLLTSLSKPLSKEISTDQVELLDFELRRVRKFRVNADIPAEWKDELDSLAFKLKVGKYELLTFIVGAFLGKVKGKDHT